MIWRNGRTSTPAACMSITIVVIPACLGASGLVRTVARPRSQYWAPLVHTFCPFTIQPPSTRVPRVVTAAASEPASGSLKSWHQTYSPMSVLKTQRSTWSGVAYWFTVMMFQPGDAETGHLHPGRAELLVDHDLLDGARGTAPGLGPVRDQEPRLHQCLPLLGPAQGPDPLRLDPHVGPDGLRLWGQVERDLAARSPGRQRGHVLCIVG